jgi:hypothetical protein
MLTEEKIPTCQHCTWYPENEILRCGKEAVSRFSLDGVTWMWCCQEHGEKIRGQKCYYDEFK